LLISFIIPVFNTDLTFLKKCINSIISQNSKDIEIIIIDDFSNSKIAKFLKNLKNKYNFVKIFRNKTNQGVSYSRNIGIKLSTGRYISFIDSDDYILANTIKYIKKAIIRNNYPNIVSTQYDTNVNSLRNDTRFKNVKFKDESFKSNKMQKVFANAFQNLSKKHFTIIESIWRYF
jgi:glycosyltransferase involved in cell wall biosynthesis